MPWRHSTPERNRERAEKGLLEDSRSFFQIHIVTGRERFTSTVLVPKLCNTRLPGALTGPMRVHGGQQLSWWNGCKPLVGTLVMTGLLHCKSWAKDMADEKRNERSLSNTLGIRKAIQWRVFFSLGKWCPRTSSICADKSRGFSLHLLSVTWETSLYILSGVPDEKSCLIQ